MGLISTGRLLFAALVSLLFVGGGTARAAYVISSNGQIGPGTVSGHHATRGRHPNLITGSVSSRDLANSSVTSPKLRTNAVTGGKIKNASVSAFDLAAPVRLPHGCTAGQLAKRSASSTGWACGDDQTSPTGAAGGALGGLYPSPSLHVSGGPCPNGQALTDVSPTATLTCKPGVYSDSANPPAVNVAAGPNPYGALTSGFANVAVGPAMLAQDSSGSDNVALGVSALGSNNIGGSNTAVGVNALVSNTSGNNNTALGLNAGLGITTGSGNVDIANLGGAESSTTRIGTNGNQTRAFMAGVRGITTGNNNAIPVVVDSAGQLGTVSSSRRYKTHIRTLGSRSRRLMDLRPVSFHYRQYAGTPDDRVEYGLLAEQVAKVYPELVANGRGGRPQTVMYQELPPLLLAQNQAQQRRLHRQGSRIAKLTRQVKALTREVR